MRALAAASIATLVGVGLWLGYQFITTSERFEIREIQIHGTTKLAAESVRAALPVQVGDNVFSADVDAIGDQLRSHPWIASADVRRILPHTIIVEIREYEAAGRVSFGDTYLVDATGHPFKRADVGEASALPLITGIDRATYQRDRYGTARTITAALDVLTRWQVNTDRPVIGELFVAAHGALSLRTETGTAIELGRLSTGDQLAARMSTFDAAWTELTDAERARARAIHLDARTDRVTVAFKD